MVYFLGGRSGRIANPRQLLTHIANEPQSRLLLSLWFIQAPSPDAATLRLWPA